MTEIKPHTQKLPDFSAKYNNWLNLPASSSLLLLIRSGSIASQSSGMTGKGWVTGFIIDTDSDDRRACKISLVPPKPVGYYFLSGNPSQHQAFN